MEPSDRSKYDPRLDALRAIAFLLVAIVHFSVPDWTDPLLGRQGIAWLLGAVPLAIIKTGWLGVPLFLFISGYSLALGKARADYVLDKKQFYVNRVLRIFPVWIICILLLTYTNHLSGANVFTLLLLQTQDIPATTAFNLAWSIQLEFMCYLLFPIFLALAIQRKGILANYSFFLLVRIFLYDQAAPQVWLLSYGTIFGGATIFLSGILTASLPPIKSRPLKHVHWMLGIALFCCLTVIIDNSGGYQTPNNNYIRWVFAFMPEILSGVIFLILRGVLTNDAGRRSYGRSPILALAKDTTFGLFVHIGKVSYSGYMFSLLVMGFTSRIFDFIQPSGWHALGIAFFLYLCVLILFATASYQAIEMPFLRMRRKYDFPRHVAIERGAGVPAANDIERQVAE